MTVSIMAPSRLSSPAVFREDVPGGVELVLAGQVMDTRGAGLGHAVLEIRGVRLGVDESGCFELLLETPLPDSGILIATISAKGYVPAQVQFVVGESSAHWLTDGTPVVVHDVALDAKVA
jgi:hypothetical protein